MNNQGIGWFKLDLVTYPENACFIDLILKDNHLETVTVNYASSKDAFIERENKEVNDINKETKNQAVIHKQDNDTVKIEKVFSVSSHIKKETEVIAK